MTKDAITGVPNSTTSQISNKFLMREKYKASYHISNCCWIKKSTQSTPFGNIHMWFQTYWDSEVSFAQWFRRKKGNESGREEYVHDQFLIKKSVNVIIPHAAAENGRKMLQQFWCMQSNRIELNQVPSLRIGGFGAPVARWPVRQKPRGLWFQTISIWTLKSSGLIETIRRTTSFISPEFLPTFGMAHQRFAQPGHIFGRIRFDFASSPKSLSNRPSRHASSIALSPSSNSSISLLPPLVLYRRLLRIHRDLPIEMRSLGDVYVKVSIYDLTLVFL
jgi:hypothetical protein